MATHQDIYDFAVARDYDESQTFKSPEQNSSFSWIDILLTFKEVRKVKQQIVSTIADSTTQTSFKLTLSSDILDTDTIYNNLKGTLTYTQFKATYLIDDEVI